MSRHQLLKGFVIVLGLVWFSGAICGFWLAKWNIPPAALGTSIATILMFASWGAVTRRLDEYERRFLSHARGLEGEQLIGSLLEDLSDDWHVFHGLQLTKQVDYDHIVVGPGGLFYIQTKNWLGQITRAGDELLRDGVRVIELGAIRAQAMELKTRLAIDGVAVRWLNAVLAVPFARVALKGNVKNVAVVNVRTLLPMLEHRSDELDREQIEGYVAILERIANSEPSDATQRRTSNLMRADPSKPAA